MRIGYLAFLLLQTAVAAEFTVTGTIVDRPSEAKQYGVCENYVVSSKEAALFFAHAKKGSYQDEDIIIGPCKALGTLKNEDGNARWEIYIGGSGVIYRDGQSPQWFYCNQSCCEKVGKEVCG